MAKRRAEDLSYNKFLLWVEAQEDQILTAKDDVPKMSQFSQVYLEFELEDKLLGLMFWMMDRPNP